MKANFISFLKFPFLNFLSSHLPHLPLSLRIYVPYNTARLSVKFQNRIKIFQITKVTKSYIKNSCERNIWYFWVNFFKVCCFLKCLLLVIYVLFKFSMVKEDTRFPGKQIALRLLQVIFLNITKQWGETYSDENELSEVKLLESILF